MRRAGRRTLAAAAFAISALVPAAVLAATPAQAAPQPAAPTPLEATAPGSTVVAHTPRAFTESLSATPPMGFNNWNAFGCDVNETLMKQTADTLVSSGLKAAGYKYVNIDDCWSLRQRGADGRIVPDPVKFPNGIAGVADYVHSKGLKLGLYADAGTKTCAGYPGSLGHEDVDAQTFADWGIDYLKYDNCNNQSDGSQEDFIRRYTAMRQAIDRTGRAIVYSVCEWGQSRPWLWATGVGDLWRSTGDISDNWSSVRSIIAQNVLLAPYAGPGHWNDPDMLEIGNGGMTDIEYRTHLSMWSMMAAPLIIGTDLRSISPTHLAMLAKGEILAIDQDRLGVQGNPVVNAGGRIVLDKPLADGDRAIALYNSTDTLATVSVPASATGLAAADAYRLQDVWTGRVLQAGSTIAAAVPAHGTVVYRVRPLSDTDAVAPSVTVDAGLGALVPGTTEGATLGTTVTNRGAETIKSLTVTAQGPDGWTVTPTTTPNRARVAPDASLATTWSVRAPQGTPAGRYPVTVTASYSWGTRQSATSSSEVISVAVTAPGDGRRHLSSLLPVSVANAVGPTEIDQSNGGQSEGDGALITIGGHVFTRGLGTTAAGEILYYLGGRCSQLTTQVGVDDEAAFAGPATFTVFADGAEAATSGPVATGEAPKALTADLTGANWLRLVTTGTSYAPDGTIANAHTDWAAPVLDCGATSPGDPILPQERTLFSFEDGTEGFTAVNADPGGSVAQSTAFHTDGTHGLLVDVPTSGNWFGSGVLSAPLDLTGSTKLKFDVSTSSVGTSGEISVQVGPDLTWCQGGLWAWTNAGSSRTVTEKISQISCPAGVELDLSQIRAVNVFLNGPGSVIDNIRAE